jgi:hypothetical protein
MLSKCYNVRSAHQTCTCCARAVSAEMPSQEAGECLSQLFHLHARLYALAAEKAGRRQAAPAAAPDSEVQYMQPSCILLIS